MGLFHPVKIVSFPVADSDLEAEVGKSGSDPSLQVIGQSPSGNDVEDRAPAGSSS